MEKKPTVVSSDEASSDREDPQKQSVKRNLFPGSEGIIKIDEEQTEERLSSTDGPSICTKCIQYETEISSLNEKLSLQKDTIGTLKSQLQEKNQSSLNDKLKSREKTIESMTYELQKKDEKIQTLTDLNFQLQLKFIGHHKFSYFYLNCRFYLSSIYLSFLIFKI